MARVNAIEIEVVEEILERVRLIAVMGVVDVRFASGDIAEAFRQANMFMHVGSPACRPCHTKCYLALQLIMQGVRDREKENG